jgi:two-component system, OmpR family, phosphate regulon sensor histidine kinase PhoR
MNLYTPAKLSFRLALIITAIFSLIWAGFNFLLFQNAWWQLAVLSSVLFVFAWILGYYMLSLFIYHRIRTLYKTIGSKEFPASYRKIRNRLNDPHFFEELEEEVAEWANRKNSELEGLKKQEQFRREFIGNVSHELKTPVFNIQGYILTLIDGGLEDQAVNLEYLKRAEKSINRMIAIITDLDTIARLDSGEQKLNVEKFDINALANEVTESYQLQANNKRIRLLAGTSGKGVAPVLGDKDKIRQVLNNLVENSIRYGKGNGTTKISYSDMDELILVDVSDDGIGIAENEIPRVFERFYRTPSGRAADHNGSGLGLSIVKHIIEAHQQTIHVRSDAGKGTTFAFTLKKA